MSLLGIASALKAVFLPDHHPEDAIMLVQMSAENLSGTADAIEAEFKNKYKDDPIVQLFEEVIKR